MPDFVNLNRHRVYVDDPEVGLQRIVPRQEVSATGAYADNLENTGGVFKAGSKEAKEREKHLDALEQNLESVGPKAFPVTDEDQLVERSGLHITGKDSGIPVANEQEPGDTKGGTGEDKFAGVAAVEQGEVTRGDVPEAEQDGGAAEDLDTHPEASTTEKSEAVASQEDSGTVTTEDVSGTAAKKPRKKSSSSRKSS